MIIKENKRKINQASLQLATVNNKRNNKSNNCAQKNFDQN